MFISCPPPSPPPVNNPSRYYCYCNRTFQMRFFLQDGEGVRDDHTTVRGWSLLVPPPPSSSSAVVAYNTVGASPLSTAAYSYTVPGCSTVLLQHPCSLTSPSSPLCYIPTCTCQKLPMTNRPFNAFAEGG